MAPLSERGRFDRHAFFSLLGTIKETKRESLNKKGPTVSYAAAKLASTYEGIGAMFADLNGSTASDDPSLMRDDPFSHMPDIDASSIFSTKNSPRSPRVNKGAPASRRADGGAHIAAAPSARMGPKTPGSALIRSRPIYLGEEHEGAHSARGEVVAAAGVDSAFDLQAMMCVAGIPVAAGVAGNPVAASIPVAAEPVGVPVAEQTAIQETAFHVPCDTTRHVKVVESYAQHPLHQPRANGAKKPFAFPKSKAAAPVASVGGVSNAHYVHSNASYVHGATAEVIETCSGGGVVETCSETAASPCTDTATSCQQEPVTVIYRGVEGGVAGMSHSTAAPMAAAAATTTNEPVDLSKMSRVQRMKYMQQDKMQQHHMQHQPVEHDGVTTEKQRFVFDDEKERFVFDDAAPAPAPAPAAAVAAEDKVDLSKMSRVQRMRYLQTQSHQCKPADEHLNPSPRPSHIPRTQPTVTTVWSVTVPAGRSPEGEGDSSSDDGFAANRAAIKASIANSIDAPMRARRPVERDSN